MIKIRLNAFKLLRKIIVIGFFTTILFNVKAQQQQKAQLLKEPSGWEFERFALPPSFAPGFPYNGIEELRFSPGMFNKDSASYFTYAFAAELNDLTSISENNIQNYLLVYFKGLCNSTAKDRKLIIDTSRISVSIEKKKAALKNEIVYNVLANVFGVFADGSAVKLNMEVKVLPDEKTKKVFLVFIASPLEKTNIVWQQLYQIQKDFIVPGN